MYHPDDTLVVFVLVTAVVVVDGVSFGVVAVAAAATTISVALVVSISVAVVVVFVGLLRFLLQVSLVKPLSSLLLCSHLLASV